MAGLPADDLMLRAGRGEAAAVALLSSPTGEAAAMFARLASNFSVKHSPMPFLAVTAADLPEAAGLPRLKSDHVSFVQVVAPMMKLP